MTELQTEERTLKLNLSHEPQWLLWILTAAGIVLRLNEYLKNALLSAEEAKWVGRMIESPSSGLLNPGKYFENFSAGFLLLTKFLIQVGGQSEYLLRLVPLLCSILSVILFYKLASSLLQKKTVPIALGLFALSGYLIDYSATWNPYSMDVAVVLGIYILAMPVFSNQWSIRGMFLFAAAGASAVWLSDPAGMVLTGVAVTLLFYHLGNKQWNMAGKLAFVFLVWILSSAGRDFLSSQDIRLTSPSLSFGSESFVALFDFFRKPAGLISTGAASFCSLVGSITMSSERKKEFFLLVTPLFFALAASLMNLYAFDPRSAMFIVPSILLILAYGAEQIIAHAQNHPAAVGIPLLGILFLHPLLAIPEYFDKPESTEEVQTDIPLREPAIKWRKPKTHRVGAKDDENLKAVLNYLKDHWKNGDLVYIYYGVRNIFRYYSHRFGFQNGDYLEGENGRNDWNRFIEDLNRLRGKSRVWLLFSEVYKNSGVNEEKLFKLYLDRMGTQLRSYKTSGASVYLYDLSKS